MGAVVEEIVAENRGAGSVGGYDFGLAADEAFILIEICGEADVVGDGLVVAAGFGDAVYLHREHHGNSLGFELTRQCDYGAGAPAVAVENDVSGAFLFGGQRVGGFCAEQTYDEIVGVVGAAIFEGSDVNGVGVGVAQALRDLHGGVHGIVVAHVAAEKADYDGARVVAPRTEPASTLERDSAELAAERFERESFEFADKSGSFACAESSGNNSTIAKRAPRKFGTDTRPPRIQ